MSFIYFKKTSTLKHNAHNTQQSTKHSVFRARGPAAIREARNCT